MKKNFIISLIIGFVLIGFRNYHSVHIQTIRTFNGRHTQDCERWIFISSNWKRGWRGCCVGSRFQPDGTSTGRTGSTKDGFCFPRIAWTEGSIGSHAGNDSIITGWNPRKVEFPTEKNSSAAVQELRPIIQSDPQPAGSLKIGSGHDAVRLCWSGSQRVDTEHGGRIPGLIFWEKFGAVGVW